MRNSHTGCRQRMPSMLAFDVPKFRYTKTVFAFKWWNGFRVMFDVCTWKRDARIYDPFDSNVEMHILFDFEQFTHTYLTVEHRNWTVSHFNEFEQLFRQN